MSSNGDLTSLHAQQKGRPLLCLFPVPTLLLQLPAKQEACSGVSCLNMDPSVSFILLQSVSVQSLWRTLKFV